MKNSKKKQLGFIACKSDKTGKSGRFAICQGGTAFVPKGSNRKKDRELLQE